MPKNYTFLTPLINCYKTKRDLLTFFQNGSTNFLLPYLNLNKP